MEGYSPYILWAFDAIRVLGKGFNETPQKASRPISASDTGFMHSVGAGILILETLESAQNRDAKIYAKF